MLIGSLVLLSLPVFWVGMMLLYFFAYRWRCCRSVASARQRRAAGVRAGAGHRAPTTRGCCTPTCAPCSDRTTSARAHAKGLSPWQVYGKHALRNALIPLMTMLGLDFAGLMSGVVLTETVFNWPGLGRLAVEAVFNQDIPMIMGTVLFSALLVVGANIVVDFLYLAIDPRIRYRRRMSADQVEQRACRRLERSDAGNRLAASTSGCSSRVGGAMIVLLRHCRGRRALARALRPAQSGGRQLRRSVCRRSRRFLAGHRRAGSRHPQPLALRRADLPAGCRGRHQPHGADRRDRRRVRRLLRRLDRHAS